jgi:hypothetical protein
MTPREIMSLLSKAKWSLGVIALIAGMTAAVLIGAWPPVWALVLLGSMALALLYNMKFLLRLVFGNYFTC